MQKIPAFVVALAALCATPGCNFSREAGARIYHTMTLLRPADVARRQLPGGIDSVCSRGSLTWIVPVGGNDVVIVDTGFDDQARSIKYKVGNRNIKAILLTHGHLDHAAGTAAIDAPVYVGGDDAPALVGENTFTALYPRLGEAFAGIPLAMGPVHKVKDGDVVDFDGHRFLAIATPGHTDGSTSWLYDGILFGGDGVQTPMPGEVHPAPSGFSSDLVVAYDSIRKLRDYDIKYLADAHIGVLENPGPAFRRAVERQHSEATIRDYPFFRPLGCGDDPDVP